MIVDRFHHRGLQGANLPKNQMKGGVRGPINSRAHTSTTLMMPVDNEITHTHPLSHIRWMGLEDFFFFPRFLPLWHATNTSARINLSFPPILVPAADDVDTENFAFLFGDVMMMIDWDHPRSSRTLIAGGSDIASEEELLFGCLRERLNIIVPERRETRRRRRKRLRSTHAGSGRTEEGEEEEKGINGN